jgi:hypothetical protein
MNSEHDPTELLADSVTAHGSGDMMAAAELRMEALDYLAEDDPRRPGALAAYAFTRRLTKDPLDDLIDFAEAAYDQGRGITFDRNRTDADRVIAREELSTVALHLGVLCARKGIEHYQSGEKDDAEREYNYAWEKILEASAGAREIAYDKKQGSQFLHQWQINTARREAAVTALNPETSSWRALSLAVKAVAMSPFSESQRFVAGANPNSLPAHRVRAKAKSFAGGIAAGVVCALTLIPTEKGQDYAQALAKNKLVF